MCLLTIYNLKAWGAEEQTGRHAYSSEGQSDPTNGTFQPFLQLNKPDYASLPS